MGSESKVQDTNHVPQVLSRESWLMSTYGIRTTSIAYLFILINLTQKYMQISTVGLRHLSILRCNRPSVSALSVKLVCMNTAGYVALVISVGLFGKNILCKNSITF